MDVFNIQIRQISALANVALLLWFLKPALAARFDRMKRSVDHEYDVDMDHSYDATSKYGLEKDNYGTDDYGPKLVHGHHDSYDKPGGHAYQDDAYGQSYGHDPKPVYGHHDSYDKPEVHAYKDDAYGESYVHDPKPVYGHHDSYHKSEGHAYKDDAYGQSYDHDPKPVYGHHDSYDKSEGHAYKDDAYGESYGHDPKPVYGHHDSYEKSEGDAYKDDAYGESYGHDPKPVYGHHHSHHKSEGHAYKDDAYGHSYGHDHKGKRPTYTKQPTYTKHEPTYTKHEPTYTKHEPTYTKHEPMYTKHEPMYTKHEPTYTKHEPTYAKPEPRYTKQPRYAKPQPTYAKPPPMYTEHQPTYTRHRPTYTQPPPAYTTPNAAYTKPNATRGDESMNGDEDLNGGGTDVSDGLVFEDCVGCEDKAWCRHGEVDCTHELVSSNCPKRCNLCETTINGQFSEWTPFSECTKTCGPGVRMRTRECNSPAPCGPGAQDCVGNAFETEACMETPNDDPLCGEQRDDDDCDSNSPNFVEGNPACICNKDLPTFEPENPICDLCNENSPDFVPDNPNCITDNCDEASPNFMQNNPECICNADLPSFKPDNPICDPCNENSPDFLPNNPDCDDSVAPTPADPKCKSSLTGINTTRCLVIEEYQAMTCGDCPDVNVEVAELIKTCRTPSPDLFECISNIGSMESNGQSCKMYEFKFKMSTMSAHCKQAKVKYPASSPKPTAHQYQRTNYINRSHQKGRRNIYKVLQKPTKIQHYRTTKLYKPKRMVRLMHRRY